MSLTDSGARAIVIKTLSENELNAVHDKEQRLGRYLLPFEIAKFSSKAMGNISSFWSIPTDDVARSGHCSRIEEAISELQRTKKFNRDLGNEEERLNFDWNIWRDNTIRFRYEGPASRLSERISGMANAA